MVDTTEFSNVQQNDRPITHEEEAKVIDRSGNCRKKKRKRISFSCIESDMFVTYSTFR